MLREIRKFMKSRSIFVLKQLFQRLDINIAVNFEAVPIEYLVQKAR